MMSSRGWSRVAPKTVGERSALLSKCGRGGKHFYA